MSTPSSRRRERPIARTNPSGERVWLARYTNAEGKRKSAGTFKRKREAQDAIDGAYARRAVSHTVGSYFQTWTQRHPRTKRTNATNEHRVTRVLDVRVEGVRLRDWPFADLRRRHAYVLVHALLTDQVRSALGAQHVIRALSVMAEDAITDDIAEVNAFKGVKVRASDPRVRKAPREQRVFAFDAMHALAREAASADPPEPGRAASQLQRWRRAYAEAMVRTFSDCGLRLGEVLPLQRPDVDFGEALLIVRATAHEGEVLQGTKTDHGESGAGRTVPIPPTLLALLRRLPARLDVPWLFPTPTGLLWRERNFYRDVWYPAQRAAGIDVRPHEMRHSWETHLRAAGVDPADLAEMAGHTMETMFRHYTHALRQSFDRVRDAVG